MRCGCVMHRPGMYIADAGQAYEQLDVEFVQQSVDWLFDEVKRRRIGSTVTVERGARLQGHMGGDPRRQPAGCYVFRAGELVRALTASLLARVFKAGNAWLFQKRGVPIGGL